MRDLTRRLECVLVTLWAALTLNFILPRLLPGGPEVALRTRFHGRISSATIKSLEVALGINNHDSLLQQYLAYLGNTLHGDFGVSLGFYHSTSARSSCWRCPGPSVWSARRRSSPSPWGR